jgi:hypothetical protein
MLVWVQGSDGHIAWKRTFRDMDDALLWVKALSHVSAYGTTGYRIIIQQTEGETA